MRGSGESMALVWSGWEGQVQSFIEINGGKVLQTTSLLASQNCGPGKKEIVLICGTN